MKTRVNPLRRLQGHATLGQFVSSRSGSSPSALTTQAADSSAAFVLPALLAAAWLPRPTCERAASIATRTPARNLHARSRDGRSRVRSPPRPRHRPAAILHRLATRAASRRFTTSQASPPADRQCPAGTALSASQPCSSTQRSSAASSCRCAAGKISTVIATSPCCASAGNSLGADLGNGLLDRSSEASV